MKKFLSFLVVLVMAVSIFAATTALFADTNTTGSKVMPDHITLTWTQDPMTAQTIT